MVSVCLPSAALLQHLPSYLGFSYLGGGVSLHCCSSKAQPLLLTLEEGYLLTAALPDLQSGIEKKCKKAKRLSVEALVIAVKRREVKRKGEKERCKHLNAEFQRIARRNMKAFFTFQLSCPYMTTGKTTAFIQGKEQWRCFAGAAVKRYPTPKVGETQVKW